MTHFVDTNILVRLMTNDVAALSEKAARLVEQHNAGELIILDAVLVELFFVLEFHQQYRLPRATITELFDVIVMPTPQFKLGSAATSALQLYKRHTKLDFTDCLLAVAATMNRSKLLSFDNELLKVLR